MLFTMLDEVEKYGDIAFDNGRLAILIEQCPTAAEYNVAIQNVLDNYTADIAKGMVRYGVYNGFGARKRLFHHYVPMADDLQQILIHALKNVQQVSESEIDKLFNEMQRISEWYTR